MNKKGFTLIELLAVIIILGILMIIAIPSVTRYISDSRKNSYVDTAKGIVGGARNIVNGGKLEMYDTNSTYYIPASCIKTENALKSPYGDFTEAYVGIIYDGQGYKYYWISVDDAGQGVKNITEVDKLDADNVESDLTNSDIKDVVEKTGIGNRTKINILNCENNNWRPIQLTNTDNNVSEEGGESGNYVPTIPMCNGVPCICKRARTLHTATCSRTSNGCYGSGYYVGGSKNTTTITYGNLWDGVSDLSGGDALDCDVTGTGNYERFYYVTSNGSGDNTKAVLVYYANVSNENDNLTAPSQLTVGYHSSHNNNYGPTVAYQHLPSKTQWSNNQIILPGSRVIRNDQGNAIVTFSYTNKAARLLTVQEALIICPNIRTVNQSGHAVGELDSCNFIFENVGKYEGTSGANNVWLESAVSSGNYTWYLNGEKRYLNHANSGYQYSIGVRPVIEVLVSNISKK